jgi:hypothetical protein
MKSVRVDVAQFSEDVTHFRRADLLLAVKSFDLQAIQKRYLESRSRSRTGSVERRVPTRGGIAHVVIEGGEIVQNNVIAHLTEPRGIDVLDDNAAMSSEDRVYLFHSGGRNPEVIEHPWLSYIHTVRFNKDGSRLLVASSGLDTVLEFDTKSAECVWQWIAWDHGINEGNNPQSNETFILTRHAGDLSRIEQSGRTPLLIANPPKQAIPTVLRAAFINTAEYDEGEEILATLFHAGKVIAIARSDSSWSTVIDGLNKPHGAVIYKDGHLVTDTARGQLVYKTKSEFVYYDYSNLPGKTGPLENLEWLQTSRYRNHVIATIDSNRNYLVFVDSHAKKRMQIRYHDNWAIQELAFLGDSYQPLLDSMTSWFKERDELA